MIRKVFRLSINPADAAEYERRHSPIWPELAAVLKSHGVRDYTIHLDPEDGTLIGIAEIESEDRWAAIATTKICQRWWKHMADLMPTNPDNSPISRQLRDVFKL